MTDRNCALMTVAYNGAVSLIRDLTLQEAREMHDSLLGRPATFDGSCLSGMRFTQPYDIVRAEIIAPRDAVREPE